MALTGPSGYQWGREGEHHLRSRIDARRGDRSLKTLCRWPVLLAGFSVSGCTDAVPTSDDGGLIPVSAETVEIRLPFSAFASDLRSFSGYGLPASLPVAIVAHEWAGELESRALLRFGLLPDVINVLPPGVEVGAIADSTFQPVSGKVIIRLDTLGLTSGPESFDLEADAILTSWHPETANWELAADTLGGRVEWPEPGGGPARALGGVTWLPSVADSVVLEIDSLTVAEWTESEEPDRGLRIRGTTEGSRLRLRSVEFTARVRSEVNPDSLIQVPATPGRATIIYSPSPEHSPAVIKIGGVPADRAIFKLELPSTVDPGPDVCARIPCPLELRPERLLFAGLALHSHTTVSPGFAPVDTVALQVRTVLSPERLPRSPLSQIIQSEIEGLAPELFSSETETLYQISMTAYVQSLLQLDALGQATPPPSIAILANPEPAGLEVLSFYGPGTELEPQLRLILTVADGVPLP